MLDQTSGADTLAVEMARRFAEERLAPHAAAREKAACIEPEIIREMLLTRVSERQGRLIDHDQDASMEKKKREGYF